ncbi:MAG: FtsX-like permease family protein [Erysipelotrichaceae bacterium]
MYFKLALANVKKSYKDYLIYFLTLSISVCIFYTFNTFNEQQAIIEITKTNSMIMDQFVIILNFLSIFVSIVLGFLILYANQFLIKRRKQEFGIYMLQGMENKKISLILCYETILIGMISLVTGLLLGLVFSQLMSAFIANLFIANVQRFHFIFSFHAFIITILSFFFIFVLVLFFNVYLLNKFKLIDLLQANKKHEKLKLQSVPLNILLFALSLWLIGFAYYEILSIGLTQAMLGPLIRIILCGGIGTFLFFTSLSGFMLQLVKRTNLYYRGLNIFSLRQINASINSSSTSISMICLMLFISIGALSSGINMNKTISKSLIHATPLDMSIWNIEYDQEAHSFDSKLDMLAYYKFPFVDQIESIHDMNINILGDDEIIYNISDLFPYINETNKKQGSSIAKLADANLGFVKLSDYNYFLNMIHKQAITLNEDETLLLSQSETLLSSLKDVCDHQQIEVNDLDLKIVNKQPIFTQLYTANDPDYSIIFVLNDSQISASNVLYESLHTNIKFKEKIDPLIFNSKMANFNPSSLENEDRLNLYYSTADSVYSEKSSLSIAFTYVGIYLGIVFLLTSAVILAIQQVSQASDNRVRYQILSKIGCDKKMMNHSILLQIGLYFLLPLGLAIVHSYVGIIVVNDVIMLLGKTDILLATSFTATLIALIYSAYFYATYSSYKRILNNQK